MRESACFSGRVVAHKSRPNVVALKAPRDMSPSGGLWPSASPRIRRIIRFNAHSIVDGKAQFLLAAEVAFRRLDRDMSKQKLDLIQLPTSKMAEPRATSAKIMRRESL